MNTETSTQERTPGSLHPACSAARPIGTTGRKYRSVRALIVGEKLSKKVLREFDRLVRLDRKLAPGSLKRLVRRRCKRRKCEAEALVNGLCCQHYLETLDKFEAQSRKAKGIVARSNEKLTDDMSAPTMTDCKLDVTGWTCPWCDGREGEMRCGTWSPCDQCQDPPRCDRCGQTKLWWEHLKTWVCPSVRQNVKLTNPADTKNL